MGSTDGYESLTKIVEKLRPVSRSIRQQSIGALIHKESLRIILLMCNVYQQQNKFTFETTFHFLANYFLLERISTVEI